MTNKKNNILIIHGPNLNLLGKREKEIYGEESYDEINKKISDQANNLKLDIKIYQFNSEGDIIDIIHKAKGIYDGLIINPAAYTHYSIAIRDAIKAVNIPAIEVHLSNIYNRESFRSTSLISPVCIGQISGFGGYSYILGLQAIKEALKKV